MNKKTYNKPEMKMVFLSHRGSLLAYSLDGTGQTPTPVPPVPPVTPANPPKTNARRFDWDDEE